MRLTAFAGGTAVVIAAVVVFSMAPMPFFVFSPAPATSVPGQVLEVEGADDGISGDLLLTTVSITGATAARETFEHVDGLLPGPDFEEVVPLSRLLPPDTRDQQQFFDAQRGVFDESVKVAAAVGLRLAGREDVTVSGEGAEVVGVIPGSPAEGELSPGDVIVGVNGEPVELASRLAARTADADSGEELTLTVRRDGERRQVDIVVGAIPGSEIDRPGIGIYIRTRGQQIDLPSDVSVSNTTNIGGPSAGLMLALTVYDLFDPADLTDGREVAGTGTISIDGEVGPIGGIQEKVRGAELAGAAVFLAPAGQAEAARAVAPPDMEVFEVATAQDALDALQ